MSLHLVKLSKPTRDSRIRRASAVWGVFGFPGEARPSLMIVRSHRHCTWHVYTTGAYPLGRWHGSLAYQVKDLLSTQEFSTRREAFQALQAAVWTLS